MICPKCGGAVSVIDSRSDSDRIYRRRKCKECKHLFYTTEIETPEAKQELTELAERLNIKRFKQRLKEV